MAERRPSQDRDDRVGGAPDPLGPALGALKGGRAFPPDFDPQAIARRSRLRRRTLRGGALALLSLAAFWILSDPSLTADHSAAVGSVEKIALPDGTLAQLDSGASLSWSETEGERRVRLHAGRVVFETASGSGRDLVVETDRLEARPIGTVFAVSADEDAWSALVEAGRVEVTLPASGASASLGAGQAASIDPAERGLATRPIDVQRALAWREGLLDFKNAPLAEVIAALDRYRPGRIVLLNDEAAQRRFDGVLSLEDVEQSLRIVADTSGLELLASWPFLAVLR